MRTLIVKACRRSNGYGFTLTETLVGVVLLAVFVLGVMSFQASVSSQGQNEKVKSSLAAVKARILQTATSDSSWIKTVQLASLGSHLNCIGSTAGCIGLPSSYDFDLFETDGTLVYSQATMSGYQLNGAACAAGAPCPIQLSLKWEPVCSTSDTNCRSPLIRIIGTFSSTVLGSAVNLDKYNFTINRSPISLAVCAASAPPVCGGGQIAVCEPPGWACVGTNPLYCVGGVTWNDAVTSFGPCSATINPPGVLHDTTTTEVNTAAGNNGSAVFLCIPGQPMGGFILQPGASCSAIPINGLCGPAKLGTFPYAATTNAAGLCLAGASAPVSGAGPWAWTCAGSGPGHTDDTSCVASVTASLTCWAVTGSPGSHCGKVGACGSAGATTSGYCTNVANNWTAKTLTCTAVASLADPVCTTPVTFVNPMAVYSCNATPGFYGGYICAQGPLGTGVCLFPTWAATAAPPFGAGGKTLQQCHQCGPGSDPGVTCL